MPFFDYKCDHCGHTEEKLVKQQEKDNIECSKCGKITTRQLSAPGGFEWKGGGFYETDFKDK